MAVAKKKSKTKAPKGIHLKKSSKGFGVHVHAGNGNKLAPMMGYNTRANAYKGLLALNRVLNEEFNRDTGKHNVTDHTKAVKPKKK